VGIHLLGKGVYLTLCFDILKLRKLQNPVKNKVAMNAHGYDYMQYTRIAYRTAWVFVACFDGKGSEDLKM